MPLSYPTMILSPVTSERVAVQLLETIVFPLFVLIFPHDWLQGIQTVCWLRSGMEAAWGFSLPANQGAMTRFLWRLKRGGEWHTGGSHLPFWTCPWPIANLIPLLIVSQKRFCFWQLWVKKLFIWEPLKKPKPRNTFSLPFYFPWGL